MRRPTAAEVAEHDRLLADRIEVRLVLDQYPGATEADARVILGWDA